LLGDSAPEDSRIPSISLTQNSRAANRHLMGGGNFENQRRGMNWIRRLPTEALASSKLGSFFCGVMLIINKCSNLCRWCVFVCVAVCECVCVCVCVHIDGSVLRVGRG
jgi:hypothetical protein